MLHKCGVQQQMAQQVLTQFQDNPDAWTRVPDVLERSSFPQTKVRLSLCIFVARSRMPDDRTVYRLADSREAYYDEMEVTA